MKNGSIIGLTGQTGAGKTTVARLFSEYGYPVVDADKTARMVTEKGSPVLETLAETFGREILFPDGTLNRPELAKRAFADRTHTEALDRITHPAIVALMRKQAQEAFASGVEAVVFDASQIFESGLERECAAVVSVVAPETLRRQRIMERDGISREAADARMGAQHDQTFFREHSDFLVENAGSPEELREAVQETVRQLRQKLVTGGDKLEQQ